MRFIVLSAIIISVVFGAQSLQSEQGSDSTVVFGASPVHILQSQNAVPRSVDVKITFKKAFETPPKVAVANWLLDWQGGSPQGYSISTHAITKTDFVVRYTAVGPRQLYSVFIHYFATNDPRVHVQWFETTDLGPLKSGEGGREQSLVVPIEGFTFDKAPVVVPFLTGTLISRRNYLIFIRVKGTTEKTINFHMNTWYISNIQMVRVCFVMGPSDVIWSSPEGGYRVPDGNHPWLKRGPSASKVQVAMNVPKEWMGNQVTALYGFSGYDVEEAVNMRAQITEFQWNPSNAQVSLVTWWDSQVFQMNYFMMLYRLDPDYKLFNPACAELFSECDFAGDSISICDREKDLPAAGWSKPIKSVAVPEQRVLRLFNRESFAGKQASYLVSTKCLKGIEFSYVQLDNIVDKE